MHSKLRAAARDRGARSAVLAAAALVWAAGAPPPASAQSPAGDPAYGEYLSGECVTCHQLSGHVDGIPAIVGWPPEMFIIVLTEYKVGIRHNPAMRTIAERLGDAEMAALAAYFGGLDAK